jgi:antitoxin VapB
MNAYTTKTFKSGNSTALRLPKELAVEPGTEVTITRIGDTLTITPKRNRTMAELVARLREIGPPPGPKLKRERILFPKRSGL